MPDAANGNIDFWEALIENIKEHKITLIVLFLWILLPYLLIWWHSMIWTNIPFWKILDLFSSGLSWHVWKGATAVLTLSGAKLPPVVTSLVTFISYFVALLLDFVLTMKMFKLIWPSKKQ